eukprot:1158748-Pelagomonas_calceolata.AAC.4
MLASSISGNSIFFPVKRIEDPIGLLPAKLILGINKRDGFQQGREWEWLAESTTSEPDPCFAPTTEEMCGVGGSARAQGVPALSRAQGHHAVWFLIHSDAPRMPCNSSAGNYVQAISTNRSCHEQGEHPIHASVHAECLKSNVRAEYPCPH